MNEDTLQHTYTAAIREMIEDAEEIMATVKDSAGLVMEPENKAALDRVEQEIIDLQNAVLELHKAKQQRSVTAADYAAQIKEYSQQMQELEAQQEENCRPQRTDTERSSYGWTPSQNTFRAAIS